MKKFCENIRFCLMLLYNANKFNFAILLLGNLISLLTPFVNLYIYSNKSISRDCIEI